MYIDVHCHLDMIEKEPKEVVEHALDQNVGVIVANGVKPDINRKVLALAAEFESVKACLGVYPSDVVAMDDKEIEEEITFIRQNAEKIAGIGEVGMDFSNLSEEFTEESLEIGKQKDWFEQFIDVSIELNKPITVHSRKAEDFCIHLLEEKKAEKVIMHYFSGKLKLVDKIVANGWFLSIPTCVVHSEHFQKVVERVPIEQLLCETDSPYSHPEKKFPNTPENVVASYKKIAEIKGLSLEEVEKTIEDTFNKLFSV